MVEKNAVQPVKVVALARLLDVLTEEQLSQLAEFIPLRSIRNDSFIF